MKALIFVDFINEIVHPDGQIAKAGYSQFIKTHRTLENVVRCVEKARKESIEIIWIRLGFSPDYRDCSTVSPRFSGVPGLGILQRETWSIEFVHGIGYVSHEKTITKTRISGFYKTDLEAYLRAQKISKVFIAGVATELAVSSLAREAHDRDFRVHVISDASASSTLEDHTAALRGIAKLGKVVTTAEFVIL